MLIEGFLLVSGIVGIIVVTPTIFKIVIYKVFKIQIESGHGYAAHLDESAQSHEMIGYHALDKGRSMP